MGCCVCLFVLKIEDTPAEIHHILDGNRRISEMHTIGLCAIHHRQGTAEHPSRHSVNGLHGGKSLFESTYKDELTLLEMCEAWIDGESYP